MFKFSFFTPKNHGRAQRSKSLDHLSVSRSGEAKKDGKLARLKRSLSFSERHGGGKQKGKGKENDQNLYYRGVDNGITSTNYKGRYIADGRDSRQSFVDNHRHDRRTYSCFDLRDEHPYMPHYRLTEQPQNGSSVLSTKHCSLLHLPEHAPLSSVENRDFKKEIGVVKPLSTVQKKLTDYPDSYTSEYHNSDGLVKANEMRNNVVIHSTNKRGESRSNLPGNSYPNQIIGYPNEVHRNRPGLLGKQEILLNHYSNKVHHMDRNADVYESAKCGNLSVYRNTSTSCIDVSRCLTDNSGDIVRDQKQKKYIIVKKLYNNNNKLAGIDEKAMLQGNNETSKLATSKRLQRARSEGSLLHDSRQQNRQAQLLDSDTSSENSACSNGQVNGNCYPSELLFEERAVDCPPNIYPDKARFRRSVGSTIETSIDDLLPPYYGHLEDDKDKVVKLGSASIDHGSPELISHETQCGDSSVKLFPDANQLSGKWTDNAVNSQEMASKKKRWTKKKRRVSAPVVSSPNISSRKSGRSERTLPLLHIAATEGDVALMKTLIDIGVDVNEEDVEGWPALHHAVQAGQFDAAGLLIKAGGCLSNYTDKIVHEYCTTVRTLLLKRNVDLKGSVQNQEVLR